MNKITVFVNGTAMKGGALNRNLRDAEFVGESATSSRYRFFSVRDEFPGLRRVVSGGSEIVGELYVVDAGAVLETFLPSEPEELELSVIEIADGSFALGMILRAGVERMIDATDISEFGGWRSYVESTGV